MSDCAICVSAITKINYEVTCNSCEFTCCKTCFKRYITDPEHYLQCMNCRTEFDRVGLHQSLGPTFMRTEFKVIREAMLYEIEKGLLPSTQLILEKELEIERLIELSETIEERYDELRKQREKELSEYISSTETAPIRDVIHRYIMLSQGTDLDEGIYDEAQEIWNKISDLRSSAKTLQRTFIRQCSSPNCEGSLSQENRTEGNNYRCALCRNVSCTECWEIVDDEASHQCDQDVLDTVKFIEDTSKPCPSCRSPIHKVEGCFDKNVIIPLANGLNKCASEICVGDRLVGDDFQPRTVLKVFSGTDQLYRVSQEHGETYIVSSRHNLVLAKASGAMYQIDLTTYLSLEETQRAELYGVKINAATNERTLGRLTITPHKIDTYHGFTIDGNHKFLYTDGTVLANCNQMWCTACNTAFDWRTLKLITGTFHNPHYQAWMRQSGAPARDPLDVECGQELDQFSIAFIQRANQRIANRHRNELTLQRSIERFDQMIEHILHLHTAAIPQYQVTSIHARNQALRLDLLRNRISIDNFKIRIQRSDKAESKKRGILNVLVTFRTVGSDIAARMIHQIRNDRYRSPKDIYGFYQEFVAIRQHVNQCLSEIANIYGSSMAVDILHY